MIRYNKADIDERYQFLSNHGFLELTNEERDDYMDWKFQFGRRGCYREDFLRRSLGIKQSELNTLTANGLFDVTVREGYRWYTYARRVKGAKE